MGGRAGRGGPYAVWTLLGGWLPAFAGGGLLDEVLKQVVQRPRPPSAAAFLHHYSWSFPSGHAMGSLIGYGMLAYVLLVLVDPPPAQADLRGAERRPADHGRRGQPALPWVHYFSDVVCGNAAGLLWLSACISGLEVAGRWRAGHRRQPLTGAGLMRPLGRSAGASLIA